MTEGPHRASTEGQSAAPKPAGTPESDGDLVGRVLAGDKDAYSVLMARHQDRLYRFAVHMVGSADTAKDLLQSALVKAYQSLDQCHEPERFGPWIFRILSNRCKDYLKAGRSRETALDEAWPDRRPDPAEEAYRAELRTRLHWALGQLPASQKEALILKHVEGRSYEEIADLLGTSLGSLKMRVYRARDNLRELLKDLF